MLLLSEIPLTPGRIVRLPIYVLHRENRPNRPGGGIDNGVNTSIVHNGVALPPPLALPELGGDNR